MSSARVIANGCSSRPTRKPPPLLKPPAARSRSPGIKCANLSQPRHRARRPPRSRRGRSRNCTMTSSEPIDIAGENGATIAKAHAYLAKLPPAIAGQGGHAATFTAACRLVEFGVAEANAVEILSEWNRTHCQPPWTERDLRHKLADAYRSASPRDCFTASARNAPAR